MPSFLFYATLQPVLKDVRGNPRGTGRFTIPERKELVDLSGQGLLGYTPVCIDHAGGDTAEETEATRNKGFFVPPGLQIGRLVFLLVNGHDQLTMVGEVNHENVDITRHIIDDILYKRQRWGVSLSTNLEIAPDRFEIVKKSISHVGLTTNPDHGNAENGATWIHVAAVNPEAFYWQLHEQVLSKDPGMYMHPTTRERLRALTPPSPVGQPLTSANMIATNRVPPLAQSGEHARLAAAKPAAKSSAPPPTPSNTPRMATPAPETADSLPASNTAVPAVAPQPTQQQQAIHSSVLSPEALKEFEGLHKRYTDFLRQTVRNDNGKTEQVFNAQLHRKALEFDNEFARTGSATGVSFYDMPSQMKTDYVTLQGYLAASRDLIDKEIDIAFPASDASGANALFHEAASDPLNPNAVDRNLKIIEAIYATNSRRLHNDTEFNKKFNAQYARQTELERENEELKATMATLKRDRDAFEAEKLDLSKKLDETSRKLPRYDSASTVVATSPIATAQPTTVAAIGATAGGSSFPANTRLYKDTSGLKVLSASSTDPQSRQLFDYWTKASQESLIAKLH